MHNIKIFTIDPRRISRLQTADPEEYVIPIKVLTVPLQDFAFVHI